eukprot:423544-Rhodomonas_salina.3
MSVASLSLDRNLIQDIPQHILLLSRLENVKPPPPFACLSCADEAAVLGVGLCSLRVVRVHAA